jgi:hypothetical protein
MINIGYRLHTILHGGDESVNNIGCLVSKIPQDLWLKLMYHDLYSIGQDFIVLDSVIRNNIRLSC